MIDRPLSVQAEGRRVDLKRVVETEMDEIVVESRCSLRRVRASVVIDEDLQRLSVLGDLAGRDLPPTPTTTD